MIRLYEEVLLENDPSFLKSWIRRLIKFYKMEGHTGIKITVSILIALGFSGLLYSIYMELNKEEKCDDIKDNDRKEVCKKSKELIATRMMIEAIDQGISKLNPNNPDDRKKINHLRKQKETLIRMRINSEKEYVKRLEKLNKKVLSR